MDLDLQDGSIRVRGMGVADAARVHACRNHPEVRRFQSWRPPRVADVEQVARDQVGFRPGITPGVCQLVIEDDGAFAGDFGVVTIDPGRQAELGIALHPDAQGRGVATRACRLLFDHLFAAGLHRITARVDPRNPPSLRLFDRLGMRREGHEVECFRDPEYGEWTDEICFAVLAREWEAARGRA